MNKHRFDENDNNYRIESDELLIYITVLFVVQTFKLAGVADFFKAFCKNINHENGGGEKRIILIDFLSKKLKTVREVVFITQINVVHMLITVTNNQKKIPRTLATTANLNVRNTTWTLIKINSSKIIRSKTKLKLKKRKYQTYFSSCYHFSQSGA